MGHTLSGTGVEASVPIRARLRGRARGGCWRAKQIHGLLEA